MSEMKRWLAFLFMLSAVWLLVATPERKAFAGTFTNQGGLVFPASHITQLSRAGHLIESAANLASQAQDAATAAVQHTKDVRSQFYTLATGTVSTVEGGLGKNHPLTVKLRSLRSDLIGNQKGVTH